MSRWRCRRAGAVAVVILAIGPAVSVDEAPVAGTINSVDTVAATVLVARASKGQLRQVVIRARPTSRVVHEK